MEACRDICFAAHHSKTASLVRPFSQPDSRRALHRRRPLTFTRQARLLLGAAAVLVTLFMVSRVARISPGSGGSLIMSTDVYDKEAVEAFFGALTRQEAQTRTPRSPSDPCWQPESANTHPRLLFCVRSASHGSSGQAFARQLRAPRPPGVPRLTDRVHDAPSVGIRAVSSPLLCRLRRQCDHNHRQ